MPGVFMNPTTYNPLPNQPDQHEFEETLRLIAQLPAPEGLAERVHAGLRAKQLSSRTARILAWPAALRPGSEWMRSAAAAAIVFVVVGGGWGVYSRVQQSQPARVIVMPARLGGAGGFSGAGAMRTPISLNGPVIPNPVTPHTEPVKAPIHIAQKPVHRASSSVVNKAAAPPTAAAIK
jgi:hypothetical protein